MPISLILASLALLASPTPARATPLAVRFYPGHRIYTHPLDAAGKIRTAVLHNAAVIWRGRGPLALPALDVQLLSRDAVTESRHFSAADLAKLAADGRRLADSGALSAVAFQFGGEALLPAGVRLASDRVLAEGEALLVTQQVFTGRGDVDHLRVRARGTAGGRAVEGGATIEVLNFESRTAFRFPLEGPWYVGCGASLHTPHRWAVPEEFALDLVRLGGGGGTHASSGTRLADFFAYGAPVLAAAAGRVVAAVNDEPETAADLRQPGEAADAYHARVTRSQGERLRRGARGVAGNYVVLEHPAREFSVYAHLKPGSVLVHVGDSVDAGQRIAALGSSGNSTEPHLHFQVCDAPDPLQCAGIPVRFENVALPLELGPRALQSGDLVTTTR